VILRAIEGELTKELLNKTTSKSIASSKPFLISSYRKLVEQVAKLAYLNKDYLLFFRGQKNNYINRAGASTFYPSIYRGDYLSQEEIDYRFEILNQACKVLINIFNENNVEGYKDLKRKKFIQWSILQHYEVCATPFLDFTHSLRVACSFAQINNKNKYGFVYVFGLPYITNRISVNSEHDIANIRLLSISPPEALRPYFQEGYLAGTYDITSEYESKTELDFKNRLIAKFKFPNNDRFWGNNFNRIPKSLLYPKGDIVQNLCQEIHIEIEQTLQPGQIGEFIKEWTEFESYISEKSMEYNKKIFSMRNALNYLFSQGIIDKEFMFELDRIRKFRNIVVHKPQKIEPGDLDINIQKLKFIKKRIKDSAHESEKIKIEKKS
jgi:hypothetical protein